MEIRWTAKSLPNQEIVARLSKELNVSEPMATILVQREIDTYDKAKNFFRPALSELHDPYLMKDMELLWLVLLD